MGSCRNSCAGTTSKSIAAGTDNLISAFPELNQYRVPIAIGFLVLIFGINLRGIRESGVSFAIPTYVFISTVMVMIVTGLYKGDRYVWIIDHHLDYSTG